MDKFSKPRKTIQFSSLAISSVIFAIALYGIAMHNDFYFEIGLLLIGAKLAGGILLAPVLGRFWCGWLCPRGAFLEYVLDGVSKKSSIPGKLRMKGFKLFIAFIMAIMFVIVLLGKNPLLASEDKLASIGGFIVFICIVTTLLISIPSASFTCRGPGAVSVPWDMPNPFSQRTRYSMFRLRIVRIAKNATRHATSISARIILGTARP